jgi:parallel beta-helix repeat protein
MSGNLNGVLVASGAGRNTIEHNAVSANTTGIRIDGADNLAIRNLVTANTTQINLVNPANYAPTQTIPSITDAWANTLY